MPPAAPVPTTITSHFSVPGLMAAAWRRDSSVMAVRSRSSVLSAGISGLRLLPAVRAIPAFDGGAAHELQQHLVALVAQLLVDADLGRVVAVDGRLLGVREELLQQRLAAGGVAVHVAQQRVHLRRPGARLLVARDVERR